jgi:quercetin dioxygenase-like cupin family protein
MKIAFRGPAIGSQRIDTVEYLATPPGGHKPEHYNLKVEGFVYFTRGKGNAAVQGELTAIRAGDLVCLPAGARREYTAAADSFVECFVLNVLV